VIVEAVDIFLDLAADAYDMWPRNGRGFHTRASRLALAGTIRLILGLSVLGSLSFLSLLASLSLFAPLQLAYTIFGTGVFRGPLENIRRRAPNAGGILVILAVAIGVANSLVSVYDVVRALARKLLSYVETQILEVSRTGSTRGSRSGGGAASRAGMRCGCGCGSGPRRRGAPAWRPSRRAWRRASMPPSGRGIRRCMPVR
jgi:hypothetical protein